MEQKEFFNQQIDKAAKNLLEIHNKFNSFQIPQFDIIEVSKFDPKNIQCVQKIEMAHQNWIRSICLFRLSDIEILNLNLFNLSQMAKYDPYT